MKLSEKRQSELYDAIHEPIMQKRLEVKRSGLSANLQSSIDDMLFELELSIWREVEKALNLEDNPQ